MFTRQPLVPRVICVSAMAAAALVGGCRAAQSQTDTATSRSIESSPSFTKRRSSTDSVTQATSRDAPPLPNPRPEVAPPAGRDLTLATWNLAWLSAADGRGPIARSPAAFTRLAKYAQRLNADVIAVQEVESPAALARVFDPKRYAFHVTADATLQRTGFVYDKRLSVHVHPDYVALNKGGLRSGADLGVHWNGKWVRLLSVHLKSGCFARPLDHDHACTKLKAQIPRLEAWIDARASESSAFAVLGDFNRHLVAASDDQMWRELDDSSPPEADLYTPTEGQRSRCWQSRHPKYVDHMVLSRTLSTLLAPGSFTQVLYDEADARYRKQLSDHCPLVLRLDAPPVTSSAGFETTKATPGFSTAGSTGSAAPGSTAPGSTAPGSTAPGSVAFGTTRPPAPNSPLPSPTSSTARSEPTTSAAPTLLVKGNHSRKGARYYHAPECPRYKQVKIDTSKGEQLFPDEASARAAGYQRSPDCPKR